MCYLQGGLRRSLTSSPSDSFARWPRGGPTPPAPAQAPWSTWRPINPERHEARAARATEMGGLTIAAWQRKDSACRVTEQTAATTRLESCIKGAIPYEYAINVCGPRTTRSPTCSKTRLRYSQGSDGQTVDIGKPQAVSRHKATLQRSPHHNTNPDPASAPPRPQPHRLRLGQVRQRPQDAERLLQRLRDRQRQQRIPPQAV